MKRHDLMTTHYGHINQTLLLTYINPIKPTHTIHKSSHNFHDGNHQGELLSSSHSSNHDVHACCVEVKCCPVANIFMETLCRGNGGMKFQIVLPQRLVAKKLENQPQTFIFRVPCYLHIYIYVYIYRFWRVYAYVQKPLKKLQMKTAHLLRGCPD